MESLALTVAIIVTPAMFGGPIALFLSLWNARGISKLRKILIYTLSGLSTLVGLFLILKNVSSGARNVGILGIASGFLAIWRLRRLASSLPSR